MFFLASFFTTPPKVIDLLPGYRMKGGYAPYLELRGKHWRGQSGKDSFFFFPGGARLMADHQGLSD